MSRRGMMAFFRKVFSGGDKEEVDTTKAEVEDVIRRCRAKSFWVHGVADSVQKKVVVHYDIEFISLLAADLSKEGVEQLVMAFSEDLKSETMTAATFNMQAERIRMKLQKETQKYTE